MLDFPRWKVWLISLIIAIGVLLSIPSLIAGDAECGQLAEVASAIQDQPRPRPCRRQPPAARGRCPATRRSSGCSRWRTRSRPSFAAIRASTSATFRPPAGACPSWSAIRRRSMPRSSGLRDLTQPVGLTGKRDWDVQVVEFDADRFDARPSAGSTRRCKDAMTRRARRRPAPHRSGRARRKSRSSTRATTASSSRCRASKIPRP